MHELAEWDSFYVILGSAAGALVGLQFVVITLLAAFAMITFAAAELTSHFLCAVFAIAGAALLLLFTGIHNAWDGAIYQVLVRRRDQ
jgi:hypothetical protein